MLQHLAASSLWDSCPIFCSSPSPILPCSAHLSTGIPIDSFIRPHPLYLARGTATREVASAAGMSDSQPQQAAGGQQPQQPLRADDILKLQSLSDDEKSKCRLIMQNFWNLVQQHPPGSPEHTAARQKLQEWTQKFILRERAHRKNKMQQAAQQSNAGQSSQAGQQGQQGQNPVKQEAPAPGPQQVQAAPASNPGQTQSASQMNPAIIKHVQEFPYQLPLNGPAPGTPEYNAKIKEYRTGYLTMLGKQATLVENKKKLLNQIQERTNAGQEPGPEHLSMKARLDKELMQTKEQVDKFRRVQKQWKDEREAKQAEQQGQSQPAQQTQAQTPVSATAPQPPRPQQQQNAPQQQPQVKEEPRVKVEGGQAQQPQLAGQFNMQGNQQQQAPQQPNAQIPTSLPQQQQQPIRPPPPAHSQSMPGNQGAQFSQPGQQPQNFHPQQRPQINPMQAMQHQQSNSPHPQSATSNAPTGPPVPLSHQAAVSAANRSYTDGPRVNTPMQQTPGQGNFGSREREQLNNPKMPIPRHLNVTSPAPVHMGQARPTMQGPTNGAAGPMGQPVIPRPPPFQLEGEGDRVLSKRKLDELVRQVTGGSEEALTPEVEEVRLQTKFSAYLLVRHCLHLHRLFSNSQTTLSIMSSATPASSPSCASHHSSTSATSKSSSSATTTSVSQAMLPTKCAPYARLYLRQAGLPR